MGWGRNSFYKVRSNKKITEMQLTAVYPKSCKHFRLCNQVIKLKINDAFSKIKYHDWQLCIKTLLLLNSAVSE